MSQLMRAAVGTTLGVRCAMKKYLLKALFSAFVIAIWAGGKASAAQSSNLLNAKQEAEALGYTFITNRDEVVAKAKQEGKVRAIVSMDPAIGDLRKGDVLIEQDRIAAVAPSIDAGDAEIVDSSQMLLLPGLINGHLHTWQTGLRGLAADWTVAEYMQAMHRGLATLFKPEDIYIANLMGALNQINNGATTPPDVPEPSDNAHIIDFTKRMPTMTPTVTLS